MRPFWHVVLLHVYGKLDEFVGELGFLEDFFGDVLASLYNYNAVVHFDVAGSFFAEQEAAMTLFRCLVSSSLFGRIGSWSCWSSWSCWC